MDFFLPIVLTVWVDAILSRGAKLDRKKLDQVFLTIQKTLKLSLGRIMSSQQDIDDVVQETYLRAVASNTSNSIRDPEAYLFRTSRNIALNEKAKMYRRLEVALPVEELEALSPLMADRPVEKEAELKQQFAGFCLAVSKLPLQCRRVFVLRKVYGHSQIEISKKLGISVSTVETHIAKGMQRTRQSMADREGVGSDQIMGHVDG